MQTNKSQTQIQEYDVVLRIGQQRRKAREREERRSAARERAAARAADLARRGPTAEELRAMPALGGPPGCTWLL